MARGLKVYEVRAQTLTDFDPHPDDFVTYMLCSDCIPSISDFATVLGKRRIPANCDRCGREGSMPRTTKKKAR